MVQAGSIAMDGNTMVIGGQLDGEDYGVAYVYEWNGSSWTESAKLYPGDRDTAGEGFGYAVAIEGDQIIVGAPWDSGNGNYSGAAYVFERGAAGDWRQVAKLTANNAEAGDAFGISVDISSGTAIVGAPGVYANFDSNTPLVLFDAPASLGTDYVDNTLNDSSYVTTGTTKKSDSGA